jgi:hypothetical protein
VEEKGRRAGLAPLPPYRKRLSCEVIPSDLGARAHRDRVQYEPEGRLEASIVAGFARGKIVGKAKSLSSRGESRGRRASRGRHDRGLVL